HLAVKMLPPLPGERPRALAVVQDITARKHAELEREALLEETEAGKREAERISAALAREAELRERFLGIVSHDMRCPLSAITMAGALFARADDLPDHLKKAAACVRSSSARIEAMIADLLDFTRGRLGGGIPLSPQSMDLIEMTRQVVEEA